MRTEKWNLEKLEREAKLQKGQSGQDATTAIKAHRFAIGFAEIIRQKGHDRPPA
ncbi:hypothetical protein [Pseudovibrio sp. Tun.PSC04-5.I4]|uniref:hypothetical protein n=1 Tax=Pseudovibrio sp. Tun.PSC04-5.I4 TaxID=1798213 RepID=UPI000886A11B|nr:hypothetical protein [Pseudovibrio sp. Tun.PSC04-5.I4]SDQ99186.1 hypothetical protein SAMN04515695_2210 [Pseudovibrio sp. Tun.PSC04-5.I4]